MGMVAMGCLCTQGDNEDDYSCHCPHCRLSCLVESFYYPHRLGCCAFYDLTCSTVASQFTIQ